jgi:hypothetical protein
MDTDEKLKFIKDELNKRIERHSRKRNSDKRRALGYKVIAVCFAAAITILLGVRVDATLTEIFRDVALIPGAMITVVNAIDAFYDYRSLWIRRTLLLARLYSLEREVLFYEIQPEQGETHMRKLDEFLKRLDQILEDDLQNWMRLRSGSEPQGISQAQEQGSPKDH